MRAIALSDSNPATTLTIYDASTLTLPAGHPDLRVRNLTVTGTANIASTTTSTGQFLAGDGTKTAPSYSFTNDPDTGLYSKGANNPAISAGDTLIMDWGTTLVTSAFKIQVPAGAVGLTFGGTGATNAALYANTGSPGNLASIAGDASVFFPFHASKFKIGAGVTVDCILTRRAAAGWQFGDDDAASPVAQTISFQGARGGTDTNTAAVTATIQSSLGTGTGAVRGIRFLCAVAAASGTTQHTTAELLSVTNLTSGDNNAWNGNRGGAAVYKNGVFVDAGGPCFASAVSTYATPDTGLGAGRTAGTWIMHNAASNQVHSPNGRLLCGFYVEARTTDLTIANPATGGSAAYLRSVFTNEGAAGQVIWTLPTAAAAPVGYDFTFIVQAAQNVRIVAAAGDTIRIAGSVSAAAGRIDNATIGGTVRLVSINATEWIAVAVNGTWTVT